MRLVNTFFIYLQMHQHQLTRNLLLLRFYCSPWSFFVPITLVFKIIFPIIKNRFRKTFFKSENHLPVCYCHKTEPSFTPTITTKDSIVQLFF